MQQIRKYPIDLQGELIQIKGKPIKILGIIDQKGSAVIYVLEDAHVELGSKTNIKELYKIKYKVIGTSHEFDEDSIKGLRYISSLTLYANDAFHFFAGIEK